jgi:WD40 repeat protein/uncharacterized caspase-like protein
MKTNVGFKTLAAVSLLMLAGAACWAQKPGLVVQTGHADDVNSVAISPNGKIVASGSRDRTIRLWEIATGTELRAIIETDGMTDEIGAVAFSPDGKTLAVCQSNTVKIWDIQTGTRLRVLDKHHDTVGSLAYSADGKMLVSGSMDEIKVWDVSTGTVLQTFLRNTSSFLDTAIALSSDGTILAGVTDDPRVKVRTCEDCRTVNGSIIILWDTLKGTELERLKGRPTDIKCLAFSADGKILAGGSGDGTIILWNVSTGTPTLTLTGHTAVVNSVVFTREGQTLASGSNDSTIRIWDGETGTLRHRLTGHAAGVTSVAFSSDGTTLASGSIDRTIRLWAATTGAQLSTLKGYGSNFLTVAVDPRGRFLASASSDGLIRLWDLYSDAPPRALASESIKPASASSIRKNQAIAFSPDGTTLASGGLYEGVRLWNLSTGKQSATLTGDSVGPLAFSPDGKYLAGVEFKTIKLWDVSSGKLCVTFEELGLQDQINEIAFSADGKTLLSGSNDRYTRVWDVSTGERLRMFELQSNSQMTRIFLSPDGKTEAISNYLVAPFVASPEHGKIDLFEIPGGSNRRVLKGLAGLAAAFAFSPDGKVVAAGDSEGKIILWNRSTGEQLQTLSGHSNGISSLAFSANGKTLASGSEDGTTRLWDASTGSELVSVSTFGQTDWLVVSPNGLFDGSPAAWKRIIYRFNNNTFDYAPVEAYFNDFFYPGLLKEIFEGKRPPPPEGKELAKRDRRRPSVMIEYVEVRHAPQANDSSNSARSNDNRVNIKVDVTENVDKRADSSQPKSSGAQGVRLFRNGSLVKLWQGSAFDRQNGCEPIATKSDEPRRAVCQVTARIVAGDNQFTAYAFNHDNVKSADAEALVKRDERLQRAGTAYIVAIGINEYANPDYELRYAVADAKDFGIEVKRQQKLLKRYEKTEVIPLYDKDATRENILLALKLLGGSDKLPANAPKPLKRIKKAEPEDLVMVYFAGHGTAHEKQFYLIPHDLGYDGLRALPPEIALQLVLAHSISDRDLQAAFERVDAGRLLLVIDACNSGQALEAEEKRRGPMNSKGLAQLAYEKGMYVLTASQSFQAAQEVSELKHGLLTFVLIEEGLKQGKAEKNDRGEIVERKWLDYATRRVPEKQIEKMKQRELKLKTGAHSSAPGNRGASLLFVEGDNATVDPDKRGVQRPRVFYRRELETKPLIVARSNAKIRVARRHILTRGPRPHAARP